MPADEQMIAESINEPAIGDLNGDGVDDVVVATNETYEANPPSGEDIGGLIGQGLTDLLANAAGGSSRVYAVDGATGHFLPGWPIKLNGAIQTTLPLIGPGQNPAIVEDRRRRADRRLDHRLGDDRGAQGRRRPREQRPAGAPTAPPPTRPTAAAPINLFESASIGRLLPAGRPGDRQVRAHA